VSQQTPLLPLWGKVEPEVNGSTRVVNLRREGYDVYIGRHENVDRGRFGNPYVIGRDGDRNEVIAKYRAYMNHRLTRDPEFREAVAALRGMRLGCFCKPAACHGDVLAEAAELL
jgi:hypothetical protein